MSDGSYLTAMFFRLASNSGYISFDRSIMVQSYSFDGRGAELMQRTRYNMDGLGIFVLYFVPICFAPIIGMTFCCENTWNYLVFINN